MLHIEKIPVSDLPHTHHTALSFWANPRLLSIFAQKDYINAFYLLVKQNQTIKAIMPVFENKKWGISYIYQPRFYRYTTIDFFTDSTSLFHIQNEQIDILTCIALFLKKNYKKINIALQHTTSDIRPFKVTGFTIDTLYTYHKTINTYDPATLPRILKRQLTTATNDSLYIKENWDIPTFQSLSKTFKGRKGEWDISFDDTLFSFLDSLHQQSLCTAVVAYKDDNPIAYRIILTDTNSLFLYDMLAVANDIGNTLGAGASCLDFIFQHFSTYLVFDFCGANIPNIAFFKSQFQCELMPYFTIKGLHIF